ncbi:hypothetical protein WJX72_002726 [[Myrmecia] bisecta]|uniref:Non-specific serine/threonine protein kinase n=1 Tax=[Myrmecia] bisecta TaxID=41462 RepID=A0AAW1PXD1_9CHLO
MQRQLRHGHTCGDLCRGSAVPGGHNQHHQGGGAGHDMKGKPQRTTLYYALKAVHQVGHGRFVAAITQVERRGRGPQLKDKKGRKQPAPNAKEAWSSPNHRHGRFFRDAVSQLVRHSFWRQEGCTEGEVGYSVAWVAITNYHFTYIGYFEVVAGEVVLYLSDGIPNTSTNPSVPETYHLSHSGACAVLARPTSQPNAAPPCEESHPLESAAELARPGDELAAAAAGIALSHVDGIVGSGVTGNVYSCRLPGGAAAALKLAPCGSWKAAVLEHEAEAYRAASCIQGRYLPRLLAAGVGMGNRCYLLATELVARRPLDPRRQPGDRALAPYAQEALAALHGAGVLHDDVRGDNILVLDEPCAGGATGDAC